MDYIDRLRKLRQASGISQIQVSQILGMSVAAYGMYETRQREMGMATFVKLCYFFKVTPNELLGFDEP